MTNAIGQLRITGMSYQDVFGTPAATADYFLPLQDTSFFVAEVMKEENTSATGDDYSTNDIVNGNRYGTFSNTVKVGEGILPLFFLQKFTDTVVDNADGTYTHTMAYTNGTNSYVTLFMQDDNRQDYRMQDVLFSALPINIELNGFITLGITAQGKYPEQGTYTVAREAIPDFVSRHATFSAADYGSSLATAGLRSATLEHNFTLSPESDNHEIGNQDLAFHQINQSQFQINTSAKMPDRAAYDDFTSNQKKALRAVITDTNRTIGTGAANPSIQFDYPSAKILPEYTEEGGLGDNLSFSTAYRPLSDNAESTSPLEITVTNEVADYTA